MKKLFCFVFIVFLLSLTVNCNPQLEVLAEYNLSGTYSFYVSGDVAEKNYYSVINSGTGNIVSCNAGLAKTVRKQMNNILGESLCFEGEYYEIANIINTYDANILQSEILNRDLQVFYLYSPVLTGGIATEYGNVNMQIAYNQNVITIGVPIILGSY